MTIEQGRRLTLVERAARNVDHAAVEARCRAEAEHATVERIKTLRRILFHDAPRSDRLIDDLTTEASAVQLLRQAHDQAHDRLVLGIVEVAIDERWGDVVKAGTRHFGSDRTAALVEELWTLTTGRDAD